MGNCNSTSVCSAQRGRAPNREITILLLGLDNAGKTTVVSNLNNDPTDGVTPTIGFSSTTVHIGRFEVSLFDIGGGNQIRGIWERYYAQAYGIIYVVDSTAPERLGEARESLHSVVQDPRVAGKPMLVLANKQDQDGAIDKCELQNRLDLSTCSGNHISIIKVVKSTALFSRGNQARAALRHAVLELLETIDGSYADIFERVRTDTEKKRAQEAREKQERAERVRLIREERERQAALSREEEADGICPEEKQSNPFRPVEEVIKTIEDRVNKNKAAAKASKSKETDASKLTVLRVEGNSESMMVQLDSAAEQNHNSAAEQCGPLAKRCGPPVRVANESEVEEMVSSGSLSSTESLTDVTEHMDSGCSTPDVTSARVQQMVNESNQSPGGSRVKALKTHSNGTPGTTFLSRLKHRNRTAPAAELVVTAEKPPPPKLSWVTPIEPGALDQLPELPKQLQSLPPIRMTKVAPGMGERPFLLAEDITVVRSAIRILPPLAN